jgi:tetratricopeptide (TPR) repeat protein
MKVQTPLIFAAALAVGTPAASAQSIVSRGVGLARDCYLYARAANDPRGGVEVCNQSLKRELLNTKDKAATHDNRGVMLDALGQVDDAERDFHTAIVLDPSLGDPYVNLGSMLIKKRQYQEALDHINKGLDLGMGFPHIGYYDRAVAEQLLGRNKEAYYDYKKVLELEPGYTQASERLKDFTVIRVPAKNPS